MKKQTIQVRRNPVGPKYLTQGPFELVATIRRVLRAECIGNFNPIFCTYKGKRTLVHSEEGDLSDPFRREESYLKTLFIEVS